MQLEESLDLYVKKLCKASNSLAVVELVTSALQHPTVFFFGEIWDLENVQKLADKECLEKLKVFTFGTVQDLNDKVYLSLTEKERHKLRLLTVLSCAQKQRTLTFQFLKEKTRVDRLEEVDALLIDCVYNDLVHGKLDAATQSFTVESFAGRDVQASEIKSLIDRIDLWSHRIERTVESLAPEPVAH